MTIATKIKQQEAAVEMLQMLVSTRRARQEKLDAAVDELNRLKADGAVLSTAGNQLSQKVQSSSTNLVKAISQDVAKSEVAFRSAGIMDTIHYLKKEQAELSNTLHKVPPGQSCPELVDRILVLHNQIEDAWTQKSFLERNEMTSQLAPLAHDQQKVTRSVENITSKAELTLRRQKLCEKVSKLKRKISDPKATPASVSKWEIEMVQTVAALDEVTAQRALL